MKILMPYSLHDGFNLDSNIVLGGIEKFTKHVKDVFPSEIFPVNFSGNTDKYKVLVENINMVNPDFIFLNRIEWANPAIKTGLPIILLMHDALDRGPKLLVYGKLFDRLSKSNCHFYFVSKKQEDFFRYHTKRISGVEFSEASGYINPSYVDGNVDVSTDFIYDCSTVGRNSIGKDPFIIHRKLRKSNKISLVMTNDFTENGKKSRGYIEKNATWSYPRLVKKSLNHNEIMTNISKSKMFCSTWPFESWGITSMEALSLGVPVLLLTDKSLTHASEIVAGDDLSFLKLRKNCKMKEFEEAVDFLSNFPISSRKRIANETYSKHSKENWKKTLEKAFQKRYDDKISLKRNLLEL